MYEWSVIMKWLSGVVGVIVICVTIYNAVKLSQACRQGNGESEYVMRYNNEMRDGFGIILPCALLVYFLFDLVIVIMCNTV